MQKSAARKFHDASSDRTPPTAQQKTGSVNQRAGATIALFAFSGKGTFGREHLASRIGKVSALASDHFVWLKYA
jgi:hypothetical protein